MVVFEERGNRSTQRKTSRCRVENQQTQPTYDTEYGNRTRATLVGRDCAIRAHKLLKLLMCSDNQSVYTGKRTFARGRLLLALSGEEGNLYLKSGVATHWREDTRNFSHEIN